MSGTATTTTKHPAPSLWEADQTPTPKEKLIKKSWEEPFVPIGLAGMLATIAYGVYGYKNRGPMSTSRYLLKFRVLAQGAVVSAMILGATLSTRKPRQ